MAFETHGNCTACLVEGATTETWDDQAACSRLGVAVASRCRMCLRTTEGVSSADTAARLASGDGCPKCGATLDDACYEAHRCPFCGATADARETEPATTFALPADVARALERWAEEEGLPDADALLSASFVGASVAALHAALQKREVIETTFDVADFLFSAGAGATAGSEVSARESSRSDDAPDTIRAPSIPSLRRVGGAREELLALASVAAADGEASPEDHMALRRAATKRNHPPLFGDDIRVWRPAELDPPATLSRREEVLEEMLQMAWADGQFDPSELRIVRDYGRAWGIDPERLDAMVQVYTFGDVSRFERWARRLALFLFPARS